MIKEVSHINEGVGADALVSAKVFERIIRMETIDRDFKLQTIALSVQKATDDFVLP
jgi:hypothetical protein